MRSPEGQEFWSTGVYREIVKPKRLVLTDSFADPQGKVVPATHYGMSPDFALEMQITVTFAAEDGMTRMTLKHAGIPPSDRAAARQGWNGSFDKLVAVLQQ